MTDKTGLDGRYDFRLLYTPDNYKPPKEEGISRNSSEARPDPEGPGVFSALQEQLGLRLEAGKGPVEMLVVDRAERPSGN